MEYNYLSTKVLILLALVASLSACGVKVAENDAKQVMDNIYKARKSGSFHKEFRYYAREDFKIVPFEEVESTLRNIVGQAGQVKSIKHLYTRVQNRNQLGKGLVKYLIFSYEVEYSSMKLKESYFFLGSSEKPKLVYMTLQMLN